MRQDSLNGEALASEIVVGGRCPTVLAFHGFTGTPNEVKTVCEAARTCGLRSRAPLLVGHGESSDVLSQTTFDDWLAGARTVFDVERKRGPVILVGLSAGSLIATKLSLEAPADVKGLVLLANAFWLKAPYPSAALALLDRLGAPRVGVRKKGSDIGDPAARRSHISYNVQPLHAAISLFRAGQRLRDEAHRVHRPTWILHGARDQVCPVDNAWKLASLIGPAVQRVSIYPASHHIMTRDSERPRLHRELSELFHSLSIDDP